MSRFVNRGTGLNILGLLMAVVLIVLLAWSVVAGPTTVLRILRYGDTNIDDYSHYPGRELSPGAEPFLFARAQEELQIPVESLVDYGAKADLESILADNDTIAFLVIDDDAIVYERYYQGHRPSSLSQLFSVSKSVTSSLVGMAIADGYFEGVDQPITDFVPELGADGFDEVTLQHLLTMMSGSDYQENDNPFAEHVILNFTPQLEERILRVKMETLPGTVFRYKSGDNALLGLALSRALAPETISQYAQRRLWAPIGMEDRAVWTIDHEGDGLEKTWCCLATSTRDLAKFGRLYLKQGVWGERQILPSSWVEQSTRDQVPEEVWPDDYASAGWHGYGYQWWLASERDGDYFAQGKDGQFLYVNPTTETIIVRLGWSQDELRSSQWLSLFQRLAKARE